jgi:dihydrofolate synthase/folylpolyglutamate synthase
VSAIVRELVPHFDRIVVTQYQENPRAVPAQKLLEIVATAVTNNQIDVVRRPTPKEAWQFAIDSAAPGECICIAGSFYLAAEMRTLIQAAVCSEPLAR